MDFWRCMPSEICGEKHIKAQKDREVPKRKIYVREDDKTQEVI